MYAALIYQIDDDVATTPYDTPVTMTTILDNDVSTSPLTFDSITNGTNGTCTLLDDGSTVVYSPEPGFTDIDVCLYTVCNVNQLCDEAVSFLALWLQKGFWNGRCASHISQSSHSYIPCVISYVYMHHRP